jgi:aromatic-L-amino-acid decarboxylase
MSEEHPLEPSAAEMRDLVRQAMERVVPHIESLPRQPAADTAGAVELARSLVEPLPRSGTPWPELLDFLFERAVPKSFNTAGPGYLAYIPGGGLFHAAVADLIADAVNRYTGVFAAAPALSQIEANVIAWFAEIVGYPAEARGILTSGGSLATFTALVTARRERLPEDFLSGILYVSDQTHHAVEKSALLAGFPRDNVRAIPSDESFRIRLDLLEERIEADRRQGLTPFLVVGNAGTTNTGAVDPLAEVADIARRQGLWFHVDGAYGGFFLLTEEGRRRMRGIERSDSVVLDPHKGFFLPYGTGALLTRDGEALRRAHSVAADYMPPIPEDRDLVDFSEISPELTKPFRGLRVWLPLKLLGITPFVEALEEKMALTRWAAEELRRVPGIEILAEPQVTVVAFRWNPGGIESAELNRRNRLFLERINARDRVHLSGTMLGDRFALRICVVSFRTHRDRVEAALEDIRGALAEMEAEGK